MAPPQVPRRSRWWLRLLLALVSAELSLQAGAAGYRYWATRMRRSPPADAAFTVLCLGDSHTFGIGADAAHSFPRQLEGLLKARWPEQAIRVVNAGVPGFNSSQMRHRLASHLWKTTPDLVLVLGGGNDLGNFTEVDLTVLKVNGGVHVWTVLDRWFSSVRLYRLVKLLVITQQSRVVPLVDAVSLDDRTVLVGVEDVDQAQAVYEQLLRQQPENPIYHLKLGRIYAVQGKLEQAATSAKAALTLDPTSVDGYVTLGHVLRLQKKLEQAKNTFLFAAESDASDARSWFGLNFVYLELGQAELARQALKEGYRRTHHLNALVGVGLSYPDQAEAREAMQLLLQEAKADFPKTDSTDWRRHEQLTVQNPHTFPTRILEANLEQMVTQVTAAGMRLGLLTYPTLAKENVVNQTIRTVAARYPDVLLIDTAEALAERFADPTRALLSADGWHPNAGGYGVLAHHVLEALDAAGVLAEPANAGMASKNSPLG